MVPLPSRFLLWQIPTPRRARTVAGTEPEDAVERAVLVELEMREGLLAVAVVSAGLEHEHVEAALRQLLCNDGATGARPDHDDITHLPASDP